MTEKMTQTFTMAFTAKCAECSVCERSTACNLSGLFYILYKESASPCFLHCCSESVCEKKSEQGAMSTAAQIWSNPFSSTFNWREEVFFFLLLYVIYRCCMFTCLCVCVCLVRASSLSVSVDSSNMGHYSSEVSIGKQLTNKAGAHANSRP